MADREQQSVINHRQAPSDSSEAADAIQREIDCTRESMDRTLDELQRRVSPAYIANKTVHQLREASSTMYRTTLDTIKEHPVPAAIAALGLAYLIGSTIRDRSHSRRDHTVEPNDDVHSNVAESAAASVKNRVGAVVASAKQSVADAAHSTRESLSHAGETIMNRSREVAHSVSKVGHSVQRGVRHGYVSSRDAAEHSFHEHPLLLGAGVFAAGIAMGIAIPATRKENELLGEYRDGFVDTTRDRVTRAARSAGQAVTQAARRESLNDPVRLVNEMRGGVFRRENASARDAVEDIGRRASAVVGDAVEAVKEELSSPRATSPGASSGKSMKSAVGGSAGSGM